MSISNMSGFESVFWDRIDPVLRGPYRSDSTNSPRPFEVLTAAGAPGFSFGRIVSGDAWPIGLPRVARSVSVPGLPDGRVVPEVPESRVVAWFEGEGGARAALCWREPPERLRWSVDPAAWIRGLLSEAYVVDWKKPATSRIPLANYSRLPRFAKGIAQRFLADPSRESPKRFDFPQRPLDDLVEVIRKLCFSLCFGSTPEITGVWPGDCQAAITLTHDLDTSWILSERRRPILQKLVATEVAMGYKGAWYVTANRLSTQRHAGALRDIIEAKHELGPHGWNHDSKLSYIAPARKERRMRKARQRFEGLGASGVRTPWYCRDPDLFRVLARYFSYDSSVPNVGTLDSATSNSGCCTIFPYRPVDGLFELPLTLPPDTFSDLAAGYRRLREVADAIIARGGVVVVILHPEPQQSANDAGISHYLAFLRGLDDDYGRRLWRATPLEIVTRYRDILERGG
jgi:peptidoglycan/xylan/chitin deacetylase (PgdA/CDA1 family)